MLPTFPKFKHLEWSDRQTVESYTRTFPPYSDFNFVSMWSWNTRRKMMISDLNSNLVLLFYDYLTEKPFLTFIGTNDAPATAGILLEYSERTYNEATLRLVPEAVARCIPQSLFTVTEDIDANDYILSVSYLSKFDTLPRSSHSAASTCQRFLKKYPHITTEIAPIEEISPQDYLDFFKQWAKIKELDTDELNEYSAFERFIRNKETGGHIVTMHDGATIVAFATYELLGCDYAVCHFGKANKHYAGIYDGLYFAVSKALQSVNVRYWNLEQDLGIPSLRLSKTKYKPEFYLKKYIVEIKKPT